MVTKETLIKHLQELIKTTQQLDISYEVDGVDYPAKEILDGLKNGNELGHRFYVNFMQDMAAFEDAEGILPMDRAKASIDKPFLIVIRGGKQKQSKESDHNGKRRKVR